MKGAAFQDVESLTMLLISIPADSDDLVFLYIHTNIITIYDSIKPILAFLQFPLLSSLQFHLLSFRLLPLLSFRLNASERRNLTSATQQVGSSSTHLLHFTPFLQQVVPNNYHLPHRLFVMKKRKVCRFNKKRYICNRIRRRGIRVRDDNLFKET